MERERETSAVDVLLDILTDQAEEPEETEEQDD
jgi:hypothetical protein